MARSCLIAGQRKITRYGPEAIDTAKCFMFRLFAIGFGRVKRDRHGAEAQARAQIGLAQKLKT